MTKFYVVATPIGNLEDITLRAIRVLSEVDLILCEDTRVTKKLLNKYQINKLTESYHSKSKISKTEKIIELLKGGKNLALVSDAGTPTISDPGSVLVREIREKLPFVQIITIPGPSAILAALSISGVPTAEFIFLGFIPHKKGRETLFKEIKDLKRTVVFYESPHRILKTLNSLNEILKDEKNRKVSVAREMTKIFEELVDGSAEEVLNYFQKNPEKVRGEFVVIVSYK